MSKAPLSYIASDTALQFGYLMKKEFEKLVYLLVKSNAHCPFGEVSSIRGIVAAKCLKGRRTNKILPNESGLNVKYQELRLKRGIFRCFDRNSARKTAQAIRQAIKDFDAVYRAFEKSLIASLISTLH